MKKIDIEINKTNINNYESKTKIFRTYLNLINLKKHVLTDKMIDILSLYMEGLELSEIRKLLKMQASNFSTILKQLRNSTFLKGDNQLNDKISSFAKFVNSSKETELTMTFKFVIDGIS